MKKLLIATTALVATAGVAAADVKISGLGRFGINYVEDRGANLNDTRIGGRLRFNIDASTETDSGVTFGGRLRLQYDIGHPSRGVVSVPNQGLLYASYAGMRLEVGNTNTAIDTAGLWYASEIGYDYSISGNGVGDFFAYNSTFGNAEYVGIFASYTFGDFTGRMSYIQPDQFSDSHPGVEDELSLSVDWASGPWAVSAAYAKDAGGVAGDDFFLGVQYEFGQATVALLYYDEEFEGVNADPDAKTITLTGSYALGATTLKGFVSSSDDRGTEDVSFGLGADYDLGGATLAGAIGRNWNDQTVANVGVRFSF